MTKNFTEWHTLERIIEDVVKPTVFKTGEIWWGSIGINIGNEEDGKNALFERPILVFRKYNKDLFLGIPLTSKVKDGKNFYIVTVAGIERSLILSQARTMSAKRLQRKLYHVSDSVFSDIQRAFMALTLEQSPSHSSPSRSLR